MKEDYSKNIMFNSKGNISVIGYKTFRGMVAMLKKANKNCKKHNVIMKYEIQLPLKY